LRVLVEERRHDMPIIDGKAVAKEVRREVARKVQELAEQGLSPRLSVVLVGDDPASAVYVRNKERACKKVGIREETIRMAADVSEDEILGVVEALNEDSDCDGILVQLPLPSHVDPSKVVQAISPEKDVDGFHPENLGRLFAGLGGLVPCTPAGIMRLLREYGVDVEGKRAVVVGRSLIVGRPLAVLLMHSNATVTICHSRTRELGEEVSRADVVVAAVGRPRFVRGEWIKPGAVVVDVGVNRMEDGSLCGDVNFEAAAERAGLITPVPGGVGPMTIAMLLENTVRAACLRRGLRPPFEEAH